jgi:hypothetical protein
MTLAVILTPLAVILTPEHHLARHPINSKILNLMPVRNPCIAHVRFTTVNLTPLSPTENMFGIGKTLVSQVSTENINGHFFA